MFGGGSRWVAKCLQESVLIVFNFIWKVCLSDMNFATLLDPAPMTCLNKENKSHPWFLFCQLTGLLKALL